MSTPNCTTRVDISHNHYGHGFFMLTSTFIVPSALFRKKKGKLYEPAVRASKPASSSTGQHDNMYAEVRETNGQPEKPPLEFDGGAASTSDYDYAVVPKAGVFGPDGVAATEEAPDRPQSTPIAEHQYASISKDGSSKPQDSTKAHHRTPPPKPSPFSGTLYICSSLMRTYSVYTWV